MKRFWILGGLVAGNLVAGVAWGYTTEGARWSRSDLPVTYVVDVNSAPSGLRAAAAQAAQDSLASWANPQCSAFRSTYGGTVSGGVANPNDNRNVFLWYTTSWPAELGGPDTIGVTTPVWF